MSTHDGGPAFPVALDEMRDALVSEGMTLRDWFAGQALGGLLTHDRPDGWDHDLAARTVYAIADAMLAAREDVGGAGE